MRRAGSAHGVARARSALFTDATLMSSIAAVLLAGSPTTSRAISTARCRGELDGDDEGELDRLPADGHLLRLILAGRDRFEQPVRVRLEPGHFVTNDHPLRTATRDDVKAGVRRDAVKPAPQQRLSLKRSPSARLEGRSPARSPRRRRTIRACGSSGRAAGAGTAQSQRRMQPGRPIEGGDDRVVVDGRDRHRFILLRVGARSFLSLAALTREKVIGRGSCRTRTDAFRAARRLNGGRSTPSGEATSQLEQNDGQVDLQPQRIAGRIHRDAGLARLGGGRRGCPQVVQRADANARRLLCTVAGCTR